MTDSPERPDPKPLDVADRQMLSDIKANVLGTSREDLRIGRFRVLRRLGEGSMGVVFAAIDEQLQRNVAIKLLHSGVVASAGEGRARVLREAQALARLTHPNIVQVHEVGEHDGQMFMAMELVEGQSLDQLQRVQPARGWKSILSLYVEAGRGLAAAHAKGLIHRDFKPHNVLVDTEGRVRVVDFGLARGTVEVDQLTTQTPVSSQGAIERAENWRLTATGAVLGTPAYMAPELFDGEIASVASDQFSFCVSLYEAVYGRRPFEGARLHDVVSAAQDGRVTAPPTDRPAARWLFKTLCRGLAPAPSDRFPSMDALLAELERDRGRRWKRGAVVAVVVLVGGVAWWAGTRVRPRSSEEGATELSLADERRLAEQERQRGCWTRVEQMRTQWDEARSALDGRTPAPTATDRLTDVLDREAEQFLTRWERSCVEDVEETGSSCREGIERLLDEVTSSDRGALREDIFHRLTYELELCFEAGVSAWGRAEVETLASSALSASWEAEAAGDLDGAMEHARRAIELAEDPSERLTRLRAMLMLGSIHEARGELHDARNVLREAHSHALLIDADVLAIDITLKQAKSEALNSGDLDQANIALDIADELLGDDPNALPLRRALWLETSADVMLHLERRCNEAIGSLSKVLELRNAAIKERRDRGQPTETFERLAADAALNIANAKFFSSIGYWPECTVDGIDDVEILEDYRQARQRFASAVGSERHIVLARYDYNIAAALLGFDQPSEALSYLRSALSIYESYHGPESLPASDTHLALAEAYRQVDDPEQARHHAERNVAIRLLNRGEEGQRLTLAEAYDGLGVILHEADDLDGAREAVRKSIAVLTEHALEDPSFVEMERLHLSYANLALIEWDRRDHLAAKDALTLAHGVQQRLQADGSPHADLPQVRLVEARLMLDRGQARRALELLDGAENLPGINDAIQSAIDGDRKRARKLLGL